ncbi:MAG: ABC transporter substrate-binding protein [Chloroflexi bacterium]|nr:ABC transporter substrate-binding protein [Chloroflexota bacterium]
MQQGNYWRKVQEARVSRRKVLKGGAALGVGVAGLAIAGCSDDKNDGGAKTSTGGTAAPKATEAPPQSTAAKTKGGIYRAFSFDALALDSFDPHQTQFGPMYSMHSAVFSKVLQYDDDANMVMSTDLADGMPEQPDKLTYIIKIRKGAKFHDSARARANFPNVAGRELTAEDVKYSMERQINDKSPQRALYYRAGHWKTIDKLELVDSHTLKVTTKAPIAPFLHYLADRNAFIVPKELVDANDAMNSDKAMIGSGPFQLEEFKAVEVVKVRRNASWFAADDSPRGIGTGRPFLDGYDSLWTPQSDSTQEAALNSKQVDSTGFADTSTTQRVAKQSGMVMSEMGTAGFLNTRLWMSEKSPFKDLRLRKAMHLAVDRERIGQQMYPSAPGLKDFLVAGPVSYPITAFAIPQNELEKRPGFRSDKAGRDADIAEAKKLWAAGNGPASVKMIFAGIPAYIPDKAMPEFKRQMQEVLGLRIEETVDPTGYNGLAQAFLHAAQDETEGSFPSSWGFDNGWIDLDDWVYPYFHTGGTKNSFLLSDAQLDAKLDAQRAEFDRKKRQALGYEIQDYLLESVCARLDYCSPVTRGVSWSYLQNDFKASWFGSNFLFANVWLDQSDPNYAGRPA